MSSFVAKSSSSSAGNGLVATSDISAGQYVLQMAPDVIAPAWPCSMTELDEEEMAVVQLESGAGASFRPFHLPAGGCDDWMCGEVQALWLLAIRCALRSRFDRPMLMDQIFSLEDHCDRRPAESQRVIEVAAVKLSGALYAAGLLEQTPALFARLIGVLLTNVFGIRNGAAIGSQRLDVRAPTLAFSLSASLFNHSCNPNVHTDHLLQNGLISFRASQSIKTGEECFISCALPILLAYFPLEHVFFSLSILHPCLLDCVQTPVGIPQILPQRSPLTCGSVSCSAQSNSDAPASSAPTPSKPIAAEASCAASRAIAGGSICTKTTREQDRCGGSVSRVEL